MRQPLKKLALGVGAFAGLLLLFVGCGAVGKACEGGSDRVIDAAMDAAGVDESAEADEVQRWLELTESFGE